MRAAVLDVGSNSVQLLVADVGDGTSRQVAAAERITRLADGLTAGGPLDPAAARRTLDAIAVFAVRARALGAVRIWIVGTRPFRLATDGEAFRVRIESEVRIPVEVLSGDREAELSFAGAVVGVGHMHGPVLTVDIGGGSTEIVSGCDGRPVERASLPIGAVVLTERYLRHDPPADDEIAALQSAVGSAVTAAPPICRAAAEGAARVPLVGSGGTLATLGAIALGLDCYRAEVVHGSRLDRDLLRAICGDLATRTTAERCAIPGLDPDRAPTIVAGAVIADTVLGAAGAPDLIVSDQGLRHAVLHERAVGVPGAGSG